MKNGTTEKVKFKRLRMRLRLRTFEVAGILEMLWQMTAQNAPCGDLGAKLTNDDIAIVMEWPGDPDELVEALVDAGWLDVDEVYRLVVHDWAEHAPNYVKGNLKRHKREFVADIIARRKQATSEDAEQSTKEPTKQTAENAAICTLPPSQAKPSQVKPPPPTPSGGSELAAAAELLKSRGVQVVRPAIESCFAAGGTLADIQAACDFYDARPGAYQPNALQKRISQWAPGDAGSDGWPKAATKFRDAQAIQQTNAEAAARREQDARRKQDGERLVADLESRYGSILDGWSDEQFREFVLDADSAGMVARQYRKRGRADANVRRDVLFLLDKTKRREAG